MRIKTTFVWLSGAFAIALLSSFISTYGIPPSFTSIAKISSQLDGFNLAILNEVVKHGETMEDFLSGLTYMESRHHHRRKPKRKCNKKKWKSRLISIYKVALVLTVDLKGCANFRSVQKAVDAVPENSPARTLISIDSGTYGEKVVVNANKTNVIFQGQGYLNTAIEWNDTANSTGGTAHSFSVAIFAPNFTAYNISFKLLPHPKEQLEGKQWHFELQVIRLHFMDVDFMEPKTHLMMTVVGIISENVSSKDPSTSFMETLDLSMRGAPLIQ
ncbi:hypothetical protein I3843_10G002100 [Carya illinoinensis]|nr:hypothetical protein I3760_10G002300 [Carya illinoinensis]KAG7958092.1 hypothetical protein I3843_10G002100 [Carya illinoinensis]KAG7958093.1 hypothetical protein I3843_10G002100 [Carya illinoinensis]